MINQGSVFVGAAAAGLGTQGGLYRRRNGDDAWEQVAGGLPADTQVQAITVHPADSRKMYIGTHTGSFRSR